jgi:polygalacturonase
VTIVSNTIQATASKDGRNIRIMERSDRSRPPGLITITGNIIGSQETNVHLSGCYGVSLTGNSIYSCSYRNLLIEDSRLVTVGSNHFRRHTATAGTGIRLIDSRDCTISGCSFHDESEEGQKNGASLLELQNCQRIAVSGCNFSNGVPCGIDALDCRDVVVTGCTIADTRGTPRAKAAIRFQGEGSGNLIASCSLRGEVSSESTAGLTQK